MGSEIKPDSKDQDKTTWAHVFLAGSIEMGVAEDWQSKVATRFKEWAVTLYNPRRESWDSSWKQEENEQNFNFQVNWELNHLDSADFIFMYFDPATKSPITLLELGMYASSGKMIVCCPKGFWRRGNVQIVCTRNNIPFTDNIQDALGILETKLRAFVN
jgi:hypothetical protein